MSYQPIFPDVSFSGFVHWLLSPITTRRKFRQRITRAEDTISSIQVYECDEVTDVNDITLEESADNLRIEVKDFRTFA